MVTLQDREQAAVGSCSGTGAKTCFIQHVDQWFGEGSQKWKLQFSSDTELF